MMYLVTAYFDKDTSDRLGKINDQTSQICGNDFMTANHIPPHLTLLQFQSRQNEEYVKSIFEKIELTKEPIDVEFKNVDSMIPHTLCFPVVKNEQLACINNLFYEKFCAMPDTIITRQYSPDNFYPHVSIAKRLSDSQKNTALEFLTTAIHPKKAKIVKIVLTVGKPPKELSASASMETM